MVGWPMGSLPVDPPSWRWELNGDEGAVSRYRCPAKLMRTDEAREPVNVCDPDREGGAILTRIRMAMGVDEPVSRPWVVSLDERTIRGARAEADRPVGMSTSRAHTLAWHRRFSVGRVRPSTPDMVVQRDPAIESHTPAPFRRADGSPWAHGRCKAIGSGTGPMRGRCPRTRRIPPSSSIISNAVGSARNPSAPFGPAGLEGHEFTSRTDHGADAGGVAAPVWDEGRRVSAHRFGIRHP